MSDKLRVAVLGATGMVGQRFVTLLQDHPWFEVRILAASERSAGKTYEEATLDRWKVDAPMPPALREQVLMNVQDVERIADEVDFCFSAVDMGKEEIKALETAYALAETPVVSNNSAHRWTPDVPMIIPEINADHARIIESQRARLKVERGFVAVKPNCSIQSYTPALAAWLEYEPFEVVVSTYQAISGAGKTFADWPEMEGNVIPYIAGEEEKSEQEPLKIFGRIEDGKIVRAKEPRISSQCVRVPVQDGHTATVFVKFRQKVYKEELIEKLKLYSGKAQELGLPSAPARFIHYLEEQDRPQVKLDAGAENGMSVSIGRLREDSIYDWKFVGLSHNTLRGAAGGAIECAELLKAMDYIRHK